MNDQDEQFLLKSFIIPHSKNDDIKANVKNPNLFKKQLEQKPRKVVYEMKYKEYKKLVGIE